MSPTSGRQAFAAFFCLVLFAAPTWADEAPAGAAPDPAAPDDAAPADTASAPDPLFDEESTEEIATELGESVPDPIEPLNRQFFRFNDVLDQYVMVPVTHVYQYVIPSPVRVGIRRVFRNLKSPVYIVNNLLQLRFRDAAETFGGFLLNSTAGFIGLFDPGSEVGWKQHTGAGCCQLLSRMMVRE